jgi:outer membrane lipoprotein-sorting protein
MLSKSAPIRPLRRIFRSLVLAGTIAAFLAIPFGAPGAEDPLQAVFARLDRTSQTFKWMTASVQKTAYTAVIDESSTESGKILMVRLKPHDLRVRVDFQPPDEKQVSIDPSKAVIYYPKTNSTQEVNIGKQTKPMVEQLLYLGFGSTSQELLSAYTVRYIAAETVAGEKTQRIELTPRDKELLQHFRKIELWISDNTGLAVQQKFYEPGKNYNVSLFTHVDLQSHVGENDVKLKIPRDAHKEATIGKHHL